jgi:hypothetical protein
MVSPQTTTVFIVCGDTSTAGVEIGYGTSFLSQSSRNLLLSPDVKSVEVIDSKGKKRNL